MKILEVKQDSLVERWIYDAKAKFEDIAFNFPNSIIEIDLNTARKPKWGCAWYTENQFGFPELYRENWDTSG